MHLSIDNQGGRVTQSFLSTAGDSWSDRGGWSAVIQRLGLEPTAWTESVRELDKLYHGVDGHPNNVDRLRSQRTQRRFPLRRRVRELMPSSDWRPAAC